MAIKCFGIALSKTLKIIQKILLTSRTDHVGMKFDQVSKVADVHGLKSKTNITYSKNVLAQSQNPGPKTAQNSWFLDI